MTDCTSTKAKAKREHRVFSCFIRMSSLPLDSSSIQCRTPPEPDILCAHQTEGPIAFELVEMCTARFARLAARESSEYARAGNPSEAIIWNKLKKKYVTKHPVELVCYTTGRSPPDDVVLATIQPILNGNKGPFQRVWLLGQKEVHLLADVKGL